MSGKGSNKKISSQFKRINITIRKDQHDLVKSKALSLSALIRDLIDDRFSSNKVVLSLSSEARSYYDLVVGGMGVNDAELEPFFLEALDKYMKQRLVQLSEYRKKVTSAKSKN